MNISINSNIKQFIKVLEKEIALQNKALISALNKTAMQARTQASKSIRETYNISATDLNKKDAKSKLSRLGTERANERKKISKIIGRGAGLPVKYFIARQVAAGVSFKLKKGSQRKTIKSAFGPDIKRLGGHVFKRVTEKRLPIKPLLTTGVANMLGKKEVIIKVKTYIVTNFPRILQDQIRYFTQLKK